MLEAVEFHTGVAQPLDFACRLLRKASRRGARVLVTAPEPRLSELDRGLWTFEPGDFVPHLRVAGAAAAQLARTPIWLATQADAAPASADAPRVLVNLGADVPADVAAFERVIEIVGAEADEAQAGRARWRAWRAAGCTITHHGAPSA